MPSMKNTQRKILHTLQSLVSHLTATGDNPTGDITTKPPLLLAMPYVTFIARGLNCLVTDAQTSYQKYPDYLNEAETYKTQTCNHLMCN